jgi:hypothetical protein
MGETKVWEFCKWFPYIRRRQARATTHLPINRRAWTNAYPRAPKAFNAHAGFSVLSRLTSPHVTTTGKRKDATLTDCVNGHIHVTFHLMATAPIFQSVQISPNQHKSPHFSPQHEDSHQHGSPTSPNLNSIAPFLQHLIITCKYNIDRLIIEYSFSSQVFVPIKKVKGVLLARF